MNQQETIYIRYTRTDYGVTLPFSKTMTIAKVATALNSLTSDQNRYRLEYQGQRIIAITEAKFCLIAQGEGEYSHPICSPRDMSTFVQGLIVTELLTGDSGLEAMYPISLEAWL
jgi:hypothetical protein